MRYLIIQIDVFYCKSDSFPKPHACVTQQGHEPTHVIIHMTAIRLDGFHTVYWNGQSSLPVLFRHEGASKGITAIKALFTDGQVDD